MDQELTNDPVHTLVVDDEEGVQIYLKESLRRIGHTVATAHSGEKALEILRETPFDVIILDLRLGGSVNGMDVLKAVRWRWPETAVVILTGHGTLESAVDAIEEGIEGYLLKPAEPNEVRRAVEEALRRRTEQCIVASREELQQLEAGPFVIDLARYTASRDGEPLNLTPQEFKLLAYMIRNANHVLKPPDLVWEVRQYETDDLHEAREIIKWYIHRLRQKVEPDPSNPRYIVNVRGVGYVLEP